MATSESLIFDGNRMQQEQEEQLKLEEDERQQQLKDLLANAFDDLIEHDDTASVSSNDSHDSGRHSGEHPGQSHPWPAHSHPSHVPQNEWFASTPVCHAKAPALVTPMMQRRYGSPATTATTVSPRSAPQLLDETQETIDNVTLNQEPIQEDGELIAASPRPDDVNNEGNTQPYELGRRPRSGIDQTDFVPEHPYIHQHQQVHMDLGYQYSDQQLIYAQQPEELPSLAHQQIQYKPQHSAIQEEKETSFASSQGESIKGIDDQAMRESSNFQQRFFNEGSNQSVQLEILYQARGKQLQELKERYELLQLDSCKELRILRHEIALLQGGKQGSEASLKQTQLMLSQNKEARFELQRKLDALETNKESVTQEKIELEQQLSAAEASIESLNAQVFALGSSDTIQKIREQHETIISSLKQAHENMLCEMNEKISHLQEQVNTKTIALENVKLELEQADKNHTKEKMEHAEAMNRITSSLYQSQQQTQEMLEKSSGEEMSRLKIQLEWALASKGLTEQLSQSLQNELSDLKEQLTLYENASKMDVFVNNRISPEPHYDDTLLELGVQQKSINSRISKGDNSQGDTTLILRRELQKCLSLVKDKRNQLSKLQAESSKMKQDLLNAETQSSTLRISASKLEKQLQEASIELNLYKSAAADGNSLAEVKLKNQVELLGKDKATLEKDLQALNERLIQCSSNEAKLEELNAELQHQMGEMIQDFDKDKQAALDSCRETLEQHSETVKDMLRTELHEEFNSRLAHMEGSYQNQIDRLRANFDACDGELRQVKRLYVEVCEEKNKLEQSDKHELDGIQKQAQSLHTMLNEVDSLKASWAEQEKIYLQEKSNLQSEYSTVLMEYTELKAQLQEFELLQTEHVLAMKNADEENADLKQKVTECEAKLSAQNAYAQLKDKIDILQCEKISDQENNSKLMNELESVKLSFAASSEHVTKLEQQLNDLINERDSVQKQLEMLHTTVKNTECSVEKEADLTKEHLQAISCLTAQLEEAKSSLNECQAVLLKTKADYVAEQKSHTKTKQTLATLENRQASDKVKQSLTDNSMDNLRRDLEETRRRCELITEEVNTCNATLNTERAQHNNSKLNIATLEAQLVTERDSHTDKMADYNKIKAAAARQEVELELICTNQKRDMDSLRDYKKSQAEQRERMVSLKTDHNKILSELNDAQAELIRKASEISQLKKGQARLNEKIDRLTQDHVNEKNDLITKHSQTMSQTLEEAKSRWQEGAQMTHSIDDAAEYKVLKEKINALETQADKYELLLSQADKHFEEQLHQLSTQIEQEQKGRMKNHIDSINESLQTAEQSLQDERDKHSKEKITLAQEIEALRDEVTAVKTRCTEYKNCVDKLQRELKGLSSQTTELKLTNKKLQGDLTRMSQNYKSQVDSISEKLRRKEEELSSHSHEHTVTLQSLKQRMVDMRNEQTTALENAKKNSQGEMITRQYEQALQQMKTSVMLHVEQTNKDAAKLIRSEIHKAKISTARQMRSYYVKCFKKNIQDLRSTAEEKIENMERTLDTAVEDITMPVKPSVNVDSILSIPEHLLTDNPSRPSSQMRLSSYQSESRTHPSLTNGRASSQSADDAVRYVPLRQRNTDGRNSQSLDVLQDLGLNHAGTSPPRRFNPPPEKLEPSPTHKHTYKSYDVPTAR